MYIFKLSKKKCNRKPKKFFKYKNSFIRILTIKYIESVTKNFGTITRPSITPPTEMNIIHDIEEKHKGWQGNWSDLTKAPRCSQTQNNPSNA